MKRENRMRRTEITLLHTIIFSWLTLFILAKPTLAATVIEYYDSNLDHYFITADANEAAAIDSGGAGSVWSRTGDTFSANGGTSVCRFYGSQSPGPNSHFYTANAVECAYLKQLQANTPNTEKRWNYEGIAFAATMPANGACAGGSVPVYRAYNNGFLRGVDSNHRISANLTAIQQVVARGWNNEGVVMCAQSAANAASADTNPFGFHPALPYDEAKNIGIHWTRGGDTPYLFWSLVDPNKTGDPVKFQWNGATVGPTGQSGSFDYDRLFLARDAGLDMMQNVAVQPPGQTGGYLQPGSWLPVNETAYRNFVKETVRRYPFIRYWQVENEPNISFVRNLTGYADLQRITYEAIKESDPQAQVLMGGVAGNMGLIDMNDSYFEPVLLALDGKYMDVFDVHFYGDAKGGTLIGDSQKRLLGYRDIKTVLAYFRNLLDKNGFSHVPIWVTEMGTFSGTVKYGPQTLTQTEADQARDLLKRWIYPLSLGVKRIFWAFGLTEGFGQWDDGFFDHTGLIYTAMDSAHRNGEKKLGYYTHKKMTEMLEGSDWNTIQTVQESGNVYIYRITKNGKPVHVAWWDYFNDPAYTQGMTKAATITGMSGSKATVTEAVPKFFSGSEVTDFSTAFQKNVLNVTNGVVTLSLGANPVFVEISQ